MTYLFTAIMLLTFGVEMWYNKTKLENVKKYYLHSWKSWVTAILMVISIITIFVTTKEIVPSFLQWGWTDLFYSETTNIAMAPVTTIEELPSTGFDWRYLGIFAFWGVLSLLLPGFALSEEKMFRENVLDYKTMALKSLKFGFIHMIVGISIYVALVLSVIGFIFALIYKYYHEKSGPDRALIKTTAIHACYNFILVSLLSAVMVMKFYYNL